MIYQTYRHTYIPCHGCKERILAGVRANIKRKLVRHGVDVPKEISFNLAILQLMEKSLTSPLKPATMNT